MRGTVINRGKNSWSLVFDLGYETNPTTGVKKRKQKWVSFHGTKKEAEAALNERVKSVNGNTYVEPSKLTTIDYLRDWVEKIVKPTRRPETYRVYKSVIDTHVASSPIALMPLQRLRGSDLEGYYATLTLKATSVRVHHAVLHRALKKAVKDRLLTINPATDAERVKPSKDHKSVREQAWTQLEARRFLATASKQSAQLAAFYTLALDTGARKSELHGLLWTDVDFEKGTVTIERQLDLAGEQPTFGPTKTGTTRVVTLGGTTLTRLQAHRKAQAELKMKNRVAYQDHGLVFAKEHEDLHAPQAKLGQPLKTLGGSRFYRLAKDANVKRITFHGVRHTSITLLLGAGVPVHVVAARVGHAKASMTLNVYSHALPSQQQDAAARLAEVLHG
jgi:integrase